ncbi:MAG: hypothetical protein CMF62_02830 [Magnetococcales bacterium]|nr:hypothetical protein [Magnetococcales bacterium]|tara:strand:- start:19028 stop:19603 length:576 start_codon:yes stop_codon:yes gene_type:complete
MAVEFDTCGNLYIFNGSLYQVNIDSKGELVFEEGDYEILVNSPKDIDINKLFYHEYSLKKEAIETIQLMDEDDPEKNDVYFKEDENYTEDIKYKFAENGFYGTEAYEHMEDKFYFSSLDTDNCISVKKRKNGDIDALYETLIFHDSKLIFKTTYTEEPLYRIIINDKTIEIKSLGNLSIMYDRTTLKKIIT